MTTGLFQLRAAQLGLSIHDLEDMTIGMVTDMLTESMNDREAYDQLATPEDYANL